MYVDCILAVSFTGTDRNSYQDFINLGLCTCLHSYCVRYFPVPHITKSVTAGNGLDTYLFVDHPKNRNDFVLIFWVSCPSSMGFPQIFGLITWVSNHQFRSVGWSAPGRCATIGWARPSAAGGGCSRWRGRGSLRYFGGIIFGSSQSFFHMFEKHNLRKDYLSRLTDII